jgi:hypothetical protein
MLASVLAGFIWFQFGASAIFIITGIATLGVITYLILYVNNSIPEE